MSHCDNMALRITWYGMLATHTSKNGSSVLITSPTIMCSFVWNGLTQGETDDNRIGATRFIVLEKTYIKIGFNNL